MPTLDDIKKVAIVGKINLNSSDNRVGYYGGGGVHIQTQVKHPVKANFCFLCVIFSFIKNKFQQLILKVSSVYCSY